MRVGEKIVCIEVDSGMDCPTLTYKKNYTIIGISPSGNVVVINDIGKKLPYFKTRFITLRKQNLDKLLK